MKRNNMEGMPWRPFHQIKVSFFTVSDKEQLLQHKELGVLTTSLTFDCFVSSSLNSYNQKKTKKPIECLL